MNNNDKSLEELLEDLTKNMNSVNKNIDLDKDDELNDLFKKLDLFMEQKDETSFEEYVGNTRMYIAANFMNTTIKEVSENSRMIGDILYYKSSKTGDALIIEDEENFLFADADTPWIDHLEAYERGERTPIEFFFESGK